MSSHGVQEMFDGALRHKSPGYALGAQLTERFPDRHLIEGGGKLDLRSFTHAKKCTTEFRDGVYQQRDAYWSEEHGVYRIPEVVWQVVEWEGSAFDVITLRWEGPMHDVERHYVLAPDRERGEAFYAAVQRWNHELRDEVLVFADGCFSKDQKLFEAIKRASFDQLILEGSFKEQIREDFKFFLGARELYEEENVPWRRGALLIGPPGNGKTLCVKALIRELGLPAFTSRASRRGTGPRSGRSRRSSSARGRKRRASWCSRTSTPSSRTGRARCSSTSSTASRRTPA